MSNSKHIQSDGNRFPASLKAALVVAALGFAALAAEQPQLAAAPSGSRHVAQASAQSHDAAGSRQVVRGTEPFAVSAPELPASVSEYLPAYLPARAKQDNEVRPQTSAPVSELATTYFPAQFPPPKGDAE